jgi:hypothetical protein
LASERLIAERWMMKNLQTLVEFFARVLIVRFGCA